MTDQQPLRRGRGREPLPVPFVRGSSVVPFIDFLNAEGAPTARLLARAGMPIDRCRDPNGFVPLHACYRLLELVATGEGVPDVGLRVADRVSAFDLGAYGSALRRATTLYGYLRIGTRLVRELSNGGCHLWLSAHGRMLRINQVLLGPAGPGLDIADSYTLVVTINTLRQLLGSTWFPAVVGLRRGTDAALRDCEHSGGATVREGQSHCYMEIPLSELSRPIAPPAPARAAVPHAQVSPPLRHMPSSFVASVGELVDCLDREGLARVEVVAEAAGMSPRQLQRILAGADTSFRRILLQSRMRCAERLLREAGLPVAEVAAELGYTDTSNFSRAFRRETGTSPAAFRRMATAAAH